MTTTRFLNAHLVDPSQSIDGIGYMDIDRGVITAINLGTPTKNNKIDKIIDCREAMLAPGIVDMRVQSADPALNTLKACQRCLPLQRKVALPH